MYEDVYSAPEKHGLEFIGEIEWSYDCYNFDLTGVWADQSGNLYYEDDSGCSCPSPFERMYSVDDLIRCTREELQAHLNERAVYSHEESSMDIANLMSNVVDYLDSL